MRVFAALVWHEIRERKALLAAAAVAGVLPLLAPLLPTTGSNPPEDIREAVMWVVLGGLAPIFALLLGVGFIGRDLSENRMGFYFAQPLSGPMIWFARVTAVLLLVWAVELIIMLPTVVLSPDPVYFFYLANALDPLVPKWAAPTLMWVVSLAALLIAHAVSIVWRARTVWLVLDFLALLFVVGLGWLSLQSYLWKAWTVAIIGIGWLVIWLLIGLIAAGAVQVSAGRVDLRRGHRAMSMTLWSIASVAVVVLAGWSHWVRSAEPTDLNDVTSISVGAGEWLGIAGTTSFRFDFHPQFLYNITDGRWIPISGVRTWYGSNVRFSSESTRVLWLERIGDDELRLWYADLTESEVIARRTEIVTANEDDAFRVSSDGARVAFIDDQMVVVFDVAQEKLEMAARFDEPFAPYRLRFTSDDSLSVMTSTPWKGVQNRRYRLSKVDLVEREVTNGPEVETYWRWWDDRWTLREDRKLERIDEGDWDRLVIVNPETGEHIADLGKVKSWFSTRIVSGERLIRFVDDGDNLKLLRVFDFDGRIVNEFPVGRSERMYKGGEPNPGLLMIGHYNFFMGTGKRGVDYLTSVVDLDSGDVVRIFNDLTPVLGTWNSWSSGKAWTPGTTATRLLRGEDGALHLWNPDTDKLKQVIPVLD